MSFFLFKLIFAALAAGLMIVIGLIVRRIVQQHRAKAAPRPDAGNRASGTRPRRPGLPKRSREAVPAPREPAPPRRRQLRSLSEIEAEQAVAVEAEPKPAALAEAPAPSPAAIAPALIARLEHAFEQLQQDRITLEAYTEQVLAEQAAIAGHSADRQAAGEQDQEDVQAARDAVRWCLDWADDQRQQRA